MEFEFKTVSENGNTIHEIYRDGKEIGFIYEAVNCYRLYFVDWDNVLDKNEFDSLEEAKKVVIKHEKSKQKRS